MSSSINSSIPTLNSLITKTDALMKAPLIVDAEFFTLTAFFNEAVTVKVSVIHIETTHLQSVISDQYQLTDDQILNRLEVLLLIRYRINDDILMSLAPFTLVLVPAMSIPASLKSTGGGSIAVTLKNNPVISDRSGAPSPRSASPVFSANWIISMSSLAESAPFIELFTEKKGTLQDMVEISDKITNMYCCTFNKSALHYGETFCAIWSGTLSHPAHKCPALSAKAIWPCAACMKEGTECIYAGLSTECIACHKELLCFCASGMPNHQILLISFNNLHPKEDKHILNLVKGMIDFDPFSIKTPAEVSQDHHTESIINNAKAYVSVNT
ncbi:hypothetical protein IW262DRAFT_1464414 [Armillaria fumosa]|nr:hypothetical protein IW262DRAFT_1464414 [Armillaria fumosa]